MSKPNDPTAVPCPACQAPTGKPCATPHAARATLARAWVSEELAEGRAWAEELGMGDPQELEHIATTMFGCPPSTAKE